MPRSSTRPPPAHTGWTGLPFDVRLGPQFPAPGIGGVLPRAVIPLDPTCPARYCYDLVIEAQGPLGEPLGRNLFRFGTSTQILGAELQSVVESLVRTTLAGARDTNLGAAGPDLLAHPEQLVVTLYRVYQR